MQQIVILPKIVARDSSVHYVMLVNIVQHVCHKQVVKDREE